MLSRRLILSLLVLAGCAGGFGDPELGPDARPRSLDAAPFDSAQDASAVLVPAPCLDGDARVSDPSTGTCYLRFDDLVTWSQADARCQAVDAHLASVTSAGENALLATIALDVGLAPDSWIGANDIAAEGAWAWDFTGEPFAFESWRDGEPNNGSLDPDGEDCAVFEGDTDEWDDRSCQMGAFGYFCEREATLQ